MDYSKKLLTPLLVSVPCYALYRLARIVYHELTSTSPLRDMRGPKSPSWFVGSYFQMTVRELHTSDTRAINHIVTNTNIYQKGPRSLRNVTNLLGRGVLSVEGDEHKEQRKILNPAFGVAQIRQLTEIFIERSLQLREVWTRQIAEALHSDPDPAALGTESARIETADSLRRTTLDIIGHAAAGFNYQFNALEPADGKPNELNAAFTEMFHSPKAGRAFAMRAAQSMIPVLRFLPFPGFKVAVDAKIKMFEIGYELLAEGKAAVLAAGGNKDIASRKDVFSVLLEANMGGDGSESKRLSDAEVVAQIPAFFIAGHETTSCAIAWALHALSLNVAAQTKLRDELVGVSTDNPTMEELNALPYLENVVRETMRVHAPIMSARRVAMADDVLPLGTPYTDRKGVQHESLPIKAGQMVYIPILAVNTDPKVWGEDADKFRPERWEHLPDAKALLFTLIRAFEFAPAVPEGAIGSTGRLQRPIILTEREKGDQMPLIVRLCSGGAGM
ncbi:cytochrome P450 [Mycena rebaudengoi]|nr:cytochrome P450 [Mycena rebaudengoi]